MGTECKMSYNLRINLFFFILIQINSLKNEYIACVQQSNTVLNIQTHTHDFLLWNTKGEILKNDHSFPGSSCYKYVQRDFSLPFVSHGRKKVIHVRNNLIVSINDDLQICFTSCLILIALRSDSHCSQKED